MSLGREETSPSRSVFTTFHPSIRRWHPGRFPPVLGIIVLDVALNEEGRPVDIKVLRGTPLIDGAAIEAVRELGTSGK